MISTWIDMLALVLKNVEFYLCLLFITLDMEILIKAWSRCHQDHHMLSLNASYPLSSWLKLLSGECYRAPLMISQQLVQVMAWCRQATSHYLSQCWPRSLSPYGVTRPQWLNLCKIISIMFVPMSLEIKLIYGLHLYFVSYCVSWWYLPMIKEYFSDNISYGSMEVTSLSAVLRKAVKFNLTHSLMEVNPR